MYGFGWTKQHKRVPPEPTMLLNMCCWKGKQAPKSGAVSQKYICFGVPLRQLSYPILWHGKSTGPEICRAGYDPLFFHPGLSLIHPTIHCGETEGEGDIGQARSSLLSIRNASEARTLIPAGLQWAVHSHLYWHGAGGDHRGPRYWPGCSPH